MILPLNQRVIDILTESIRKYSCGDKECGAAYLSLQHQNK